MKKLLAICLSALMVVCLGCAQNSSVLVAEKSADLAALPLAENYVGADFGGGEYSYMLRTPLEDSTNTFEACIRMENNVYTRSKKSIIFGNYTGQTENTKYINYEIDTNGYVTVHWAGTEYKFDGKNVDGENMPDVRTGEWVHIAVVRDLANDKLHLYLDGILAKSLTGAPKQEPEGNYFEHYIGSDGRDSNTKLIFLGEIGHVACYTSALSADEIFEDYKNVSLINGVTRGKELQFSAMLTLGQNDVLDRSASFNNAYIATKEYFYEGELFETADYSFAIVGDTQRLSRQAEHSYLETMNWIVNNADERKIAATLFMGDLTDANGSMTDEEWLGHWAVVEKSLKLLDGNVPYVPVPGNHDYQNDSKARDLTKYNTYLPYEKFASRSDFGGAYQVGQTQNTYYKQTLAGVNYLFMAMEFGADANVMEWICDVIEAHPDHRIVITTHGFLDETGELFDDGKYLSAYWYFSRSNTPATSSLDMWEKYLCNYENIFMIICGHSASSTVQYKPLVGKNGNTVMSFMIDMSYTVGAKGHDSAISLFTIDEATSTLWLNTFSAGKQRLYNVQNQMKINFNTFERSVGAYYGNGMVTV